MYNDALEQLFKTTKNFSTPLSDWGKAVTEIYQRTLQQNLELLSDNFAHTSEQLKRLSHAKKPEDLINIHKECISENMTLATDNIQKILRTATQNIDELSSLCNNCQMQSIIKNNNKETVK